VTTTFLVLGCLGAALVVNAWRPLRLVVVSVPVMFAGWLTAELAPALLAIHLGVSAWFIVAGAVAGWQGWVALGLSLAIGGGLAMIIAEAMRGKHVVEEALRQGLGHDYLMEIEPRAPYDDHIPLRHLILPFWLWRTDVRRHRSIPYGPVRRRNLLDVYTSKHPTSNSPVLLYIHGGGWSSVSNKNHQGKPLMLHLASRGWVCVAINYSLSPRATFPAHLIDCKRALAWIRAQIHDFGGDPSFVVVTGGSAGGHLSALTALTPNQPEYQPGFEHVDTSVAACVPSYGVYDWTPDSGIKLQDKRRTFFERVILKVKHADDPDAFIKASPHHQIKQNIPPFFVIHGGNDTLVDVREGRAFVERLHEASTEPVVYAELDRTQHAFDVFHSIRTTHVVHGIERFCDWVHGRTVRAREEEPA